jgi:hypothetical protein
MLSVVSFERSMLIDQCADRRHIIAAALRFRGQLASIVPLETGKEIATAQVYELIDKATTAIPIGIANFAHGDCQGNVRIIGLAFRQH